MALFHTTIMCSDVFHKSAELVRVNRFVFEKSLLGRVKPLHAAMVLEFGLDPCNVSTGHRACMQVLWLEKFNPIRSVPV